MLSPAERNALRQVGRNTALGKAFRRYWLPVLSADQAPPSDSPPVRLRVLNESLVLFRDTSGRLGVIDAYCPHEGSPLSLARNQENGLMCMLHGWKFDVEGHRVDSGAIHSVPVRTIAYPAVEQSGAVWIYMGPPEEMPPTVE